MGELRGTSRVRRREEPATAAYAGEHPEWEILARLERMAAQVEAALVARDAAAPAEPEALGARCGCP